uniref:Uncharacterized protein n=1 Tax=Musa acuminata subsp. malaccensis TaxID=214687 RepID=A0A804U5M7_MUSAM
MLLIVYIVKGARSR